MRREALELLPPTSGLSPAMSEAVLDGMAADWTAERLEQLVQRELGGPGALDGFVGHGAGRMRALGPDLCVQIASGSVPGVGANALIRSLLVKSPTLLKPGRGDVALSVLFARALADADPDLADAVAVVYWAGGSAAIEAAALSAAEQVVAYGADATVAEVRARAPATARFVGYHHRVGVGVVGRDALTAGEADRAAADVARAVALFDQRGCVSPQVVYVEEGGEVAPVAFAGRVAAALGTLEALLPGGTLDDAEASAVHQTRGTAELAAAAGDTVVVHHGEGASWTVIFEAGPSPPPGCVGRLVRVEPVRDALDVAARVAPLGRHLQTVAVTGLGERTEELAERLGRTGATRVATFSDAAFPPPWWRHDGQGPLAALVRWVDLEA
jgi:hypothetical protein